jgi:diguanylate cyclase (GGDEF)-like protein
MPWSRVLRDGQSRMGVSLSVTAAQGEVLTFAVNCAPITDPRGTVRGALVTLDDLTELQRKNEDLEDTLEMLQASQEQIKDQNRKLEFLATRDPLTLCLNRRAFIEGFTAAFEKAVAAGSELSCIMVDIDHFKSVNDRFGHATGDQVISLMGQVLTGAVRGDDLVCRYGGEEFCVILPEAEAAQAKAICERIRESLPGRAWSKEILPGSRKLTASFGLTTLSQGAATPEELLDQADKALFAAKDQGRNRVIGWGEAPAAPAEEAVLEEQAVAVLTDTGEDAPVLSGDLAAPVRSDFSRDAVTGLADRAAFKQRIAEAAGRARAEAHLAMVLLLELRMFRRLGDALGTAVADQVLREVGVRLEDALRAGDTLARVEGTALVARCGFDKFGVVLGRIERLEDASGVAKRLLDSLSERLELEGQRINLTCNIGISVSPLDGDNAHTLLDRAQVALHYAKRHGALGYRFYQGYMSTASTLELGLERELRGALSGEQLKLSYQPIAEAQEGRIVGLEALLRWEHPGLGLLQPGQFIGAAERSGLMVPIGRWSLKEACTQAQLWAETGVSDLQVGVNVSATQLRKEGFQEDVLALLEESGLSPARLQLELNEAALVKDLGAAQSAVEKLRTLGVGIGIDDVGAHALSLDYLKRFRPEAVKVDRSLVKGLGRGSVTVDKLRAIVKLAREMEASVTAVGVETGAQLDILQELGCDRMQGYLLCPPLSAGRAGTMLAQDRRLLAPRQTASNAGATLAEAG